jgi:hypothetical protein
MCAAHPGYAGVGMPGELHHFRGCQPTQSASEKSDSRGISDTINHTKTDKLLKEAPVTYLEFKLLIAKVKQPPENERLEGISGSILFALCIALAPCITITLMRISLAKQ